MKWFRKLFDDQAQQNGKTQPSNNLSTEQQQALCLSLQKLQYIALGAKLVTPTGVSSDLLISQQTARWAIPHAERILDAKELFQRGDIQGALSIFLSLPEAAIVQMNIGVCYAELGKKQEAESWFRKCINTIPPSHKGMLEENLRRLQVPEISSISKSDWNTPPTHATCITCRKPIPFAQKDAPYGSAVICPHCHAPRLEYNRENPLPTPPSHCKIHFGMDGRGLEHPRCPYCNKINYAIVFPSKGMNLDWYAVTEPENPSGFRFKVVCVNCNKDFFVEWNENPF